MARNYEVILDKAPEPNTYAKDFFPKPFEFIGGANDLVHAVEEAGGKAHVETLHGKDNAYAGEQ